MGMAFLGTQSIIDHSVLYYKRDIIKNDEYLRYGSLYLVKENDKLYFKRILMEEGKLNEK